MLYCHPDTQNLSVGSGRGTLMAAGIMKSFITQKGDGFVAPDHG
jgi:hypothetical protein